MISFKWQFLRATRADYFLSNRSDLLFLVNIFKSRLNIKRTAQPCKMRSSARNAMSIQKCSEAIACNNNTDRSNGQFLLWKHLYFSCQAVHEMPKTSITQNQCISHDGEWERRAMQMAWNGCNSFIWHPGLGVLLKGWTLVWEMWRALFCTSALVCLDCFPCLAAVLSLETIQL